MAREQFILRLNEGEREAYERHRKEHTDIDSLAGWFRNIADKTVTGEPEKAQIDEEAIRSAVREETRDIRDEIAGLSGKVTALDEAIRTDNETTVLAEEAYRILSGLDPQTPEQWARNADDEITSKIGVEQYVREQGTAEAFAQYFGCDIEVARRALVRCENMFPSIRSWRDEDKMVVQWTAGEIPGEYGDEY